MLAGRQFHIAQLAYQLAAFFAIAELSNAEAGPLSLYGKSLARVPAHKYHRWRGSLMG